MSAGDRDAQPRRTALVLAGGGARGAYGAGVLCHLFESVYPRLRPGFEFDVVSGTSVGAIHAAYAAASSHLEGPVRARALAAVWRTMQIRDVLRLSVGDLVGVPLRALGMSRLLRSGAGDAPEVLGGLVDVSPLERIVEERVPWTHLRRNLAASRPGVLCVSCTEIRTGRVNVFMDGALADTGPWSYDPNARALAIEITPAHVRASAAIPFLFPAVRIGERFYVDGGLRMNTPLSPALRLRAERVLVVALKRERPAAEELTFPEEAITQPAFLLGKVLDALMLDQMEYELNRMGLVNALLERGTEVYGPRFVESIAPAVREQRGVAYRPVDAVVVRPSEDVGRMAGELYRRAGGARSMGVLPSLLTRTALRGVPAEEADLLSYLYFDRVFSVPLMELGREDARRQEDAILELLSQ